MNRKLSSSRRGDYKVGRGSLLSSLLLFTLVLIKVDESNISLRPFIFVGAELMVDAKPEDDVDDIDAIDTTTNIDSDDQLLVGGDVNRENDIVESNADISAEEDHVPLPASLMKATMVGAKLREVNPPDQTENLYDTDEPEIESHNVNNNGEDDVPRTPKQPPLAGCTWGQGCKQKGKVGADESEEMNSSSSIEMDADEASSREGEEDGTKSPSSASSFAGSATAKIEAHVMKGRGRSSPPVWDRTDKVEPSISTDKKGSTDHNPPQGFRLAGRIVMSPSDGLSYFLDAPQKDIDIDGDSRMMTIPYAYLECGPTIESTTEAFSLVDMVVRHFPASASMRHWTNLSGGVTVESDTNEGEEGDGIKYINGNHEGHPKLLIALSSIQITVSGNNEESRVYSPGDVILLEDTLGKGHKMSAAPVDHDKAESTNMSDARGRDLSVLMISLPHNVHFPIYDWLEDSSYLSESTGGEESSTETMEPSSSTAASASASQPTSSDSEHAHFGFTKGGLRHERLRPRKHSSFAPNMIRPCPADYDSAYSSLFMPMHGQYKHRHKRTGRRNPRWKEAQASKESASFDSTYPPPPGFTNYEKESLLLDYLPSLRRTVLFSIGLSLTSSFIYCTQLLYPPLLVLWGGGTMVIGGALLSVLATRWGYRNWLADWEEEFRWKREVRRNKMHGEEEATENQEVDEDGLEDIVMSDNLQASSVADRDEDTNAIEDEAAENVL